MSQFTHEDVDVLRCTADAVREVGRANGAPWVMGAATDTPAWLESLADRLAPFLDKANLRPPATRCVASNCKHCELGPCYVYLRAPMSNTAGLPCSDYPPTESGEVKNVKTMGRSEGGAHTQASAEACRECPARSRTPSDLAASSSSSPVSSSLVEEIWELIEDYVAYRVWPWAGPWQHAESALRSRLTALETELNGYRVIAGRGEPTPFHSCTLNGFNGMLGDVCEACGLATRNGQHPSVTQDTQPTELALRDAFRLTQTIANAQGYNIRVPDDVRALVETNIELLANATARLTALETERNDVTRERDRFRRQIFLRRVRDAVVSLRAQNFSPNTTEKL